MKKVLIISIFLLIYLCNISLATEYVELVNDDGSFRMMEVKDFRKEYGLTEAEFKAKFGSTVSKGNFSATYTVNISKINDYLNPQSTGGIQANSTDFELKSVQDLVNEYSNEEKEIEPEGDAEHELCDSDKHDFGYVLAKPENFKCNSYNEVKYYCTKCGLEGGTDKLYFRHKWQDSNIVLQEPTCSAKGYYAIECSVCKEINKEFAGRTIPINPDNHNLVPGDIIYRPTCMTNGYRGKTCTICGKKFTVPYGEDIPMGPDYHVWVCPETDGPRDIPATCQQAGWRYAKCDICLTYSNTVQKYVPKSNHVYVEKRDAPPEVEPTCTEKGWKYINFCKWCDAPQEGFKELLPAKGHFYNDTKINDTYHKKECHWCGYKIDKEKHQFKEWDRLRIEPTCNKKGQKTFVCSCGFEKKETIDALGHNWGTYTVTRQPTTEISGAKTSICSRCGAKDIKSIPKLPKATIPKKAGGTVNLLK